MMQQTAALEKNALTTNVWKPALNCPKEQNALLILNVKAGNTALMDIGALQEWIDAAMIRIAGIMRCVNPLGTPAY